jgi:tetratricopeptide (TPR) repeat protein
MKENGIMAQVDEWNRRDTISEEAHWRHRALTELDERAGLRRTEILTGGWPFREQSTSPRQPDPEDGIGILVDQLLEGSLAWEQAHVAAAEYYEGLGKLALAEKEYEALITAIPYNVSPYLRLSRLLLKQLKYEEGLAMLNRSLHVEPTLFAYRALGAIAVDMGKPTEAVRFLELAIGKSTTRVERTETTYMLAMALGRANLKDRAIEQLRQVLVLDPSHRPAAALLERLNADSTP